MYAGEIPFSWWQGVWWHSRWAPHRRGTAFGIRLHTLSRCYRARAPRSPRPPSQGTVSVVTRPRVACYTAPTVERFHSADGRACGGTRDGLHTAVVSHLAAVFTLCGVAAALVLHDPRAHRGSRGSPSAWSHVRESRATLPPRSRDSIQPMAGRVVALEMRCTQPWYRIWRPSSHSVALLPRSCCTTLTPTVAAAGHRLADCELTAHCAWEWCIYCN